MIFSICWAPELPTEGYASIIKQVLDTHSRKEARKLIESLPFSLQGFFEKGGEGYDLSPVGRMFMKARESKLKPRVYQIRTHKNHTSLWGDGVNSLDGITDREVREMFRRIFDCAGAVTSIYLDETINQRSEEVYMEYRETVGSSLRFLLHTSNGAEYVKVEVIPGQEREVLRLIGRRIYP